MRWNTAERLFPLAETPTGLQVAQMSSGAITLTWTAITDRVGVRGYNIYRDDQYIDLLPIIRADWSTIFVLRKGERNVVQQLHVTKGKRAIVLCIC